MGKHTPPKAWLAAPGAPPDASCAPARRCEACAFSYSPPTSRPPGSPCKRKGACDIPVPRRRRLKFLCASAKPNFASPLPCESFSIHPQRRAICRLSGSISLSIEARSNLCNLLTHSGQARCNGTSNRCAHCKPTRTNARWVPLPDNQPTSPSPTMRWVSSRAHAKDNRDKARRGLETKMLQSPTPVIERHGLHNARRRRHLSCIVSPFVARDAATSIMAPMEGNCVTRGHTHTTLTMRALLPSPLACALPTESRLFAQLPPLYILVPQIRTAPLHHGCTSPSPQQHNASLPPRARATLRALCRDKHSGQRPLLEEGTSCEA